MVHVYGVGLLCLYLYSKVIPEPPFRDMDHRFHVFYTYKFNLCLLGTGGRGRRRSMIIDFVVEKNKHRLALTVLEKMVRVKISTLKDKLIK